LPKITVVYGDQTREVDAAVDSILGDAIAVTELPLEQPCAGRGTCGKCKVLAREGLAPPDETELKQLSQAELSAGYRLACRARVIGDVPVTLAPIVVYSNKIFRATDVYKQGEGELGLAIDLGSTTVAAFLTMLNDGRVCAGAATLNQQTVFGADVISRMAAAQQGKEHAERLSALAKASIIQAIDALKLSRRVRARIRKATIVGNCAMHHLLLQYPVDSLAELPFQPYSRAAIRQANERLGNIFSLQTEVMLPPLVGGFVGSDALACLAYFGFDRAPAPMAAIDLGTNGEVMVTDGERILVASTAAGPAFEGVNISCGTRAVDGAIVAVKANAGDASFGLTTIAGRPPVGLTGSGLLDLIYELRRTGVVDRSGRMVDNHPVFGHRFSQDKEGVRRLFLADKEFDPSGERPVQGGESSLYLTQQDIRELQKAKAAILAAMQTLMARLEVRPGDLQRVILTGSFGSQLNIEAVLGVGMIPPVNPDIIETCPNGAGLGAALFLDEEEFARGERIAIEAEQVDLDLDADFNMRYIQAIEMRGGR